MSSMLVVPLFDVRGTDVLSCGVKGSQLGELLSIGLPVPGGFVVTTDAYRGYMEQSGLDEEIGDLLSQIDPEDPVSFDDVGATVHNISQDASIDRELSSLILEHFKILDAGYVAVRSSAAVEENPMIYYEGGLATALNVKKDNLLSNIQYCWASLYCARSLRYMYENGLQKSSILVAVVVQEMIDAEVSGVCRTVDVANRKNDILVIEAGWGLGEAMVSGIVTPDRYVVDKKTYKVIETKIGVQFKEVVREVHRHRIVDVPKRRQLMQKLTEDQISQIARLCAHVEEYYGVPQFVEWAFRDGKFSILQTGAITV